MTKVGVNILKNQLSSYLRLANGGEKVLVTDHGRPIAILSGIDASDGIREVWQLVEHGHASWNGGKPKGSANPPKIRGKSAAEMVIEDRR